MLITLEELHDIIHDNPEAKSLADAGNDNGVFSVILNLLPKFPVKESLATELGVLEAFDNPQDGHDCLVKIETVAEGNAMLKRVISWLKPGSKGLDFGNIAVRSQLDALHGFGIITENELSVLKSIGEKTVEISVNDVSDAWARYRG